MNEIRYLNNKLDEIKYITEKEVSKITGKALSTLRNDRHSRRGIPYIKEQKTVRYNLRDVIDYMEGRKITFEG